MADNSSLINLGDLSRPATILIEKISDAVGSLFHPRQIKRLAAAEVEARKIRALGEIEISDIQRRALHRWIEEEGKKQDNMERISAQAIRNLTPAAKPDEIEKDWLTHFFDRCRLVSDGEMQSLWARILAGEANASGSFSRRTIEVVASFDKNDARLFTSLCGFGWSFDALTPLVFDVSGEIYLQHHLNLVGLNHLESIGLISFNSLADYVRKGLPEEIILGYYGTAICIKFSKPADNQLPLGKVMLTQVGRELAPISGSVRVEGFEAYVTSCWVRDGLTVYSPWPKISLPQ